jgi:hypothetical protein
MTAIRFPNSVGIGNNGGRAENSQHDVRRPKLLNSVYRNSDVVDISTEAKKRYERDNLVKLERVRLQKEAAEYSGILADVIKNNESDLRKVYRADKIAEAKNKLDSGFYDTEESYVLKKMLEKPEI